MTENNYKQYDNSYLAINDETDKTDEFDIEAKREQWKQEREEIRAEEQQKFLKERYRYLPLYTVLILAGFLILAFIPQETMHDIIYSSEYIGRGHTGRNLIYYLFVAVWFGAIGDTTHLTKLNKEPLMHNCIAIIICALLSMFVMLFSFTNLSEAQSAMVFAISKVFAVAGVAFTVYPIKYTWTHRQRFD